MMSSGGSSSDSEAEGELDKQVTDIEATLQSSPYYYEGYVQLIKLFRQRGDLDKARDARNRMRKIFPLTEGLWLEWLRDEIPLTGLFAESALELRLLFESATEDYLSVNVWVEYAQFAVEKMSLMPEGVEFPREVFERAVVACGLHVRQSCQVWDAYLDFEKAMLKSLQDMQRENLEDEELKQQVEVQFDLVEKLYKRRLTVPHIGMEGAFVEYQKVFCERVVNEEDMPAFIKARGTLHQCLPFEEKLVTSDPPSLESYRGYLEHLSETKEDLLLVNTLYQRAVAHHCLDVELWGAYLQFLDKQFRTAGAVLLPGYKLAVRNCNWESKFWLGLLRGMERTHGSHQEIIVTFEKALVDNFSRAGDSLAVWVAYCDYYRRLVAASPSQHTHEELLALFKRAREKMSEDYGKQGDPKDTLSRYHANIVKGVAEGRVIWNDIMTRHGREAEYWMEYITYTRHRDSAENCRKLFLKAVNSASDSPQRVCEAFLQFEREEGTLESFEAALTRTASQLERVRERQEMAAKKDTQMKEEVKKKRQMEKKARNQDKGQKRPHVEGGGQRNMEDRPQVGGGARSQRSNQPRKRSAAQAFLREGDEAGGISAPKRTRESGGPSANDDSEAGATPKSDSVEGVASTVTMETDEPEFKVPTVPQITEEPEFKVPAIPSASAAAGEGEGEGEGSKVATEGPKEQRTVFVSNLPQKVTKNQLKQRFAECGDIVEVRLVNSRAKFNRTNTFAYIEFTSPAPITHALSLDRTFFMEKSIYVSPFREKGAESETAGKNPSSRVPECTVFVNSIQKDTTEQDLLELFKQCGEVKEVRVVKNVQGRSKGFAYVEFHAESSAHTAVLKLDSHMLGLKKIGVAMSKPPGGVAGGGAQRDEEVPLARRSKTNISLMPRVLAKKGGATATGGGAKGVKVDSSSEPAKTKDLEAANMRSNDDFRKLFAKP